MRPFMYQSTIFGTSVRPRAPPKAEPFQTRPVTSWNGLVAISLPASATPDHHGYAPAAMTGFQRLTHHGGVAGAVERVIRTAFGQRHQMRHDVALDPCGVDEMGHAEATAPLLLAIVHIDADDLVGAYHFRGLDDVQADAAEAEHHHIGARLHLGGIDHPHPPLW